MKTIGFRSLILLLSTVLLISAFGGFAAVTSATQPLTVSYVFMGDEAQKAGFAQGRITITPGTNSGTSGYYLIYYADDRDTLKNYDELATVRITGGVVNYTVADGLMIPAGATRIAVFESAVRFLDETPSVSEAAAVAEIPVSKRLTLGTPETRFGTASDVHMDYQGYGRGAYQKWSAALDFFSDNGVDHVIVTGDMTGDTSLDSQYQKYISLINDSDIPLESVYEGIGNHGNTPSTIGLFTQYTSGSGEEHPFKNSPYYSVRIEGKTAAARDNLFIFMAQELNAPGDSAAYDNFSEKQIDWLESLLKQYSETETNIFIIEHAPFYNFGAGDRKNGGYTSTITLKNAYIQTMRFKSLLETYKDAIVMSGHTHVTLYDAINYSDEHDTIARTVHVGSTCFPNGYGEGTAYTRGFDGRYTVDVAYGSEAYLVDVYADYIVYTGYNLSTGKIIPAACLLLPIKAYGGSNIDTPVLTPDEAFEGAGTLEDPYRISSAADFKALTDGFNASVSDTESEMYGYGKCFQQTADIDMRGIDGYAGTTANGNAKCFFAGIYNGGGYALTIDINDMGQRSVFPYVYGTICNLVIKGRIIGSESAQPVRTLYGSIIHCEFDLTLSANRAHGLMYSNYGYVYNVYTHGDVSGSHADAVASSNSSQQFVNLYHYYMNAAETVVDNQGTRSKDVDAIAAVFNDRSSEQYQTAQTKLGAVSLSTVAVENGTLVFSHPAIAPAVEVGNEVVKDTVVTTAATGPVVADDDGTVWYAVLVAAAVLLLGGVGLLLYFRFGKSTSLRS